MKKLSLAILFALFFAIGYGQKNILKPDSLGIKLLEMYKSMQVEKLWLNGVHVDWISGEPDQTDAITENTTHCSAFVAAACYNMGIYILRPPEHEQELLANAQYAWLLSAEAQKQGWRLINGSVYEKAQKAANLGYMVVATYKNPKPDRAGHIVCVIPAEISQQELRASGPRVIQSGRANNSNMSFREAFHRVLKTWPSNNVLFFYNERKIRTGM